MCDFTNGIKLCSCENESIKFREQEFYRKIKGELVKIKNKKNDNIPLIFIWELFRLVGKHKDEDFAWLGRYMLPSDDIGNGLDAEWIALNLNIENCFDFEYVPQKGDNLYIRQNVILGPYISFIFDNGKWEIEHYDPFTFEIEKIKGGIINEIK